MDGGSGGAGATASGVALSVGTCGAFVGSPETVGSVVADSGDAEFAGLLASDEVAPVGSVAAI